MKAFGSEFIRQITEETLDNSSSSDVVLKSNKAQICCGICFFPLEQLPGENSYRWTIDRVSVAEISSLSNKAKLISVKDISLIELVYPKREALLHKINIGESSDYRLLLLLHGNLGWLGISFFNEDLNRFIKYLDLHWRDEEILANVS